MNASLRDVFRNFGRRRLRTAAGALGVFLTIALLVAIQIGLHSVSTSYTDPVALQASILRLKRAGESIALCLHASLRARFCQRARLRCFAKLVK